MLTTERQKRICARYSARDENGYVHCNDCPLVVNPYQLMCRAIAHYDRHSREWVYDTERDERRNCDE